MRLPRLVLLAVLAVGLLPATASAAERLSVSVDVQRFVVRDGHVFARGVATARQASTSGARLPVTQKQPATLAVSGSSTCKVLSLNLKDLNLQLLGLRVDASEINLQITGQRSGGALGQLFCRLATGLKLSSAKTARAAATSLNRRLRHRPLHIVAFRSTMTPSATPRQAAPGTCEVLDLLLGPLNLDLLGLNVDLYGATKAQPVRVLVTADPSKGILGSTFCKLASGQAAA